MIRVKDHNMIIEGKTIQSKHLSPSILRHVHFPAVVNQLMILYTEVNHIFPFAVMYDEHI